MKLDDLTGILSDAVEKAVSTAEQQILERIRFYFEDPDPNDDDETLVPRSIIVKIGDVKIKYPYLAMGTLKPIEIGVFKFKIVNRFRFIRTRGCRRQAEYTGEPEARVIQKLITS